MARQIVVGEIAGAYGIKGWVKVHSFTQPPANILAYSPWRLGDGLDAIEAVVASGKVHGGAVVAKLEGVDDRDQAIALRHRKILVSRDCFPVLAEGQYYWDDLIGLRVSNVEGIAFGVVKEMIETGANDVIVVAGEDGERLIPFVLGEYVTDVDLQAGTLTVNWDAEF